MDSNENSRLSRVAKRREEESRNNLASLIKIVA